MSDQAGFVFRLYVVSVKQDMDALVAFSHLREAMAVAFPDQHEFEVVEILYEPQRAVLDQITATPALFKAEPLPPITILGDLSNIKRVFKALGFAAATAEESSVSNPPFGDPSQEAAPEPEAAPLIKDVFSSWWDKNKNKGGA